LVDAGNPCVFVRAADVGLKGNERPERIDADGKVMARLEAIRAAAGVAMELGADAEVISRESQAVPKVAVIAPPCQADLLDGTVLPVDAMDISVRMLSMGRAHKAVPLTGALCVAVAERIEGALVGRV